MPSASTTTPIPYNITSIPEPADSASSAFCAAKCPIAAPPIKNRIPHAKNNPAKPFDGFLIDIPNAMKGKMGPMASVRGVIHCGLVLTVILYCSHCVL